MVYHSSFQNLPTQASETKATEERQSRRRNSNGGGGNDSGRGTSASREEEEEEQEERNKLMPMPVVLREVTGSGIVVTTDVDLLVACSTSLESFACRRETKLNVRPKHVLVCQNTKLTKYFEKRASFPLERVASFQHGHKERARADRR